VSSRWGKGPGGSARGGPSLEGPGRGAKNRVAPTARRGGVGGPPHCCSGGVKNGKVPGYSLWRSILDPLFLLIREGLFTNGY